MKITVPLHRTLVAQLTAALLLMPVSLHTKAEAVIEEAVTYPNLPTDPASEPRVGHLFKILLTSPPDAIYETALRDTKLYLPIGYVAPLEVARYMSPVKGPTIFMNAFHKDMQPRTRENMMEFIRTTERPGLVMFQISVTAPGTDYETWWVESVVRQSFYKHVQNLQAPKQYNDKHGLQHWGNDYEKAPWVKPCELLGEAEPCGQISQEDLYLPLKINRTHSYMTCASWLSLKASFAPKALAMTQAERDAYFDSGKSQADLKFSPWQRKTEPHCVHHMYYAPLHARVTLIYNLALLPHWKQIEDRTRAIFNAALIKSPSSKTALK